MSFSNTFAFAVARAVDVATASTFTKHIDCTISSLCDVALLTDGSPFLQRLGKVLNWISTGHTAAARTADIQDAHEVIAFLTLPNDPKT
jgi:hypothetical protein